MDDDEDSSEDFGNDILDYFSRTDSNAFDYKSRDLAILAAEVDLAEKGLEYLLVFLPSEKEKVKFNVLNYMAMSKSIEDLTTSLNLCRASLSGVSEDELIYLEMEAMKYDNDYSLTEDERPKLLQILEKVNFNNDELKKKLAA